MCKVLLNEDLNGVEMYFEGKPAKEVLADIKANGFRWNRNKSCWYAKQSNETIAKANEYSNSGLHTEVKTTKQNKINSIDLWSLTTYTEVEREKNYNIKEITKEIRSHLKNRFKFVKFSITNPYSDRISIDIKEAPFEKESIYIKAISEYCQKVVDSYNFCTSYDPYGDYGSSYNLYFFGVDLWQYTQTEATTELEKAIKDFDTKKAEFEKAEELRKKTEYQEYQKEQEIKEQEYKLRKVQEEKEIEYVNNNVEVKEIEEDNQYYVIDSKFAHLNKNNTLSQYQEEVSKGDCYNQTVKVTREIHFNDSQSLEYFSNLLLHDFDFINGTGGSKAILIHKELSEIEISEAVEKEKDGNDKILNGGQVVKELKIPYLSTTILNEWFSINGFGKMIKINGSKNRTFQPSQKFLDIIAKSGYCLTGKTQKQDKIKVVYTKTLVDYLIENCMDSIKRYTFAKTGKEIA